MKVNGKTMKNMVKEFILGQTETNLKANTKMGKEKVLEL